MTQFSAYLGKGLHIPQSEHRPENIQIPSWVLQDAEKICKCREKEAQKSKKFEYLREQLTQFRLEMTSDQKMRFNTINDHLMLMISGIENGSSNTIHSEENLTNDSSSDLENEGNPTQEARNNESRLPLWIQKGAQNSNEWLIRNFKRAPRKIKLAIVGTDSNGQTPNQSEMEMQRLNKNDSIAQDNEDGGEL